jgi:hypothetical protein
MPALISQWPLSLPLSPLVAGLGSTTGDNVLRFNADVGRGSRRRRTSARDDMFSVSYMMTEAQRVIFENFLSTQIGDGALSFALPDPFSGVPVTVSIESQVDTKAQDSRDTFLVSFDIKRYS